MCRPSRCLYAALTRSVGTGFSPSLAPHNRGRSSVFEDETQNPNFPERVDVVALGARERVGGRLLNHTLQNGAVVELGGQWVGPTQDRVLALAEELGVALFPTFVEGEHILAVDGAVKRYGGDDFALPEDALADVGETQLRLQEMAQTVPLVEPWRAAEAAAWDSQTLDTWLVANSKTGVGLGYWRTLVPALFSAEACEMSLLHFLFYCRSGGTLDRLLAPRGRAPESRPAGG